MSDVACPSDLGAGEGAGRAIEGGGNSHPRGVVFLLDARRRNDGYSIFNECRADYS